MEGEWELCKENFVPVKSGRRVGALLEVIEPGDGSKKSSLEQQKRAFVQEIRAYSGEDALEPWLRYIKWTQEHLTGSGKQELQAVLEACTQEVAQHERYVTDVRFLRVWIQYADCLPDPGDVFLFLKEKQTGLEFALFYEAYATYHELKGNCAAADAVYEDGIKRQAKPLERLKAKYFAFQTRMAQRTQRKIQEQALMGPQATPVQRESLMQLPAPGSRHPLPSSATSHRPSHQSSGPQGSASSNQPGTAGVRPPSMFQAFQSSNRAGQHQQPTQQQQLGQAAMANPPRGRPPSGTSHTLLNAGAAESGFSQSSALGLSCRGAPATALGVSSREGPASSASGMHVDEEFEEGSLARPSLLGLASVPAFNSSRSLAPYVQVRKENLIAPSAWAGQGFHTAKQQLPATTSSAPLEIFTDEEFLTDDPPPSSSAPSAIPFGSHPEPAPTKRALAPLPSSLGLAAVSGASKASSSNLPTSTAQLPQQESLPASLSNANVAGVAVGGGQSLTCSALSGTSSTTAPTPTICAPDCSFSAELLQLPSGEEISYTELRAMAWTRKCRDSSSNSSGSRHTSPPPPGVITQASLASTVAFSAQQKSQQPVTSAPGPTNTAGPHPSVGNPQAASLRHQPLLQQQPSSSGSPPFSHQATTVQAPHTTLQAAAQPVTAAISLLHQQTQSAEHSGMIQDPRSTHQQASNAVQLPHPSQLHLPEQQLTPTTTAAHGSLIIPHMQPTATTAVLHSSSVVLIAQPNTIHRTAPQSTLAAGPQILKQAYSPLVPNHNPFICASVDLHQSALPLQQPSMPALAAPHALQHITQPRSVPQHMLLHAKLTATHAPATHTQPSQPSAQATQSNIRPTQTQPFVQQVMPTHTCLATQQHVSPAHAPPAVASHTVPSRAASSHMQAAPGHVMPAQQQPLVQQTLTPHTARSYAPAAASDSHAVPGCTMQPDPKHIMPSHTPMHAAATITRARAREPTITMSTKAAFDALNDMFSDEMPHAAHASLAHQQQRKRVMEPTVTVNTQAAFEALNDMFSDDLPQQQMDTDGSRASSQRGKVDSRMSGLPASMKPISAMDVCRLANTGKLNSTQNMRDAPTARQQHIPSSSSSSMMYEDTDFIVPASLSAASNLHGSNIAIPAGMGQPLPVSFQNQTRPLIYEDTDVFSMPALPIQQQYGTALNASAASVHPQIAEQQQQQSFLPASGLFQQQSHGAMPSLLRGNLSSAADDNAGYAKHHPVYHPPAPAHYTQPLVSMYYGAHSGNSRGMSDQMPWGNPAAAQMGIYEDTELLLQDRG